MIMTTPAKVLGLVLVASLPLFAQGPTLNSSQQQTYNGYDYELWSENNIGTTSMTLTGDNGQGANAKGGTFTCSWENSLNILFRSGKKWGMTAGPTPRSAGNITIDFDATWTSNDGARMLGVYGWAFYPEGSKPTQDEAGTPRTYSDQIEYYIIQDRGGYNPATGGDAAGGGKRYGEATIDGIVYEFYVADRINRWALTGNGDVTFKQYFSVPKNASYQRTKGIISVSKHFEEWENVGMKMMDCRLYEVAMKVESYTDSRAGKGNATVSKNLLTIGGSLPSSSSGGSSSSAGPQVDCDYQKSYCGGMEFTNVQSNSNFIPSTGDCLFIGDFEVIQPNLSSTVAINGSENTCGSEWDNCRYNDKPAPMDGGYYVYVKSGTINEYQSNGWQNVVAKAKLNCKDGSVPIINKTPLTQFSVRTSGKALLVEASAPATIVVYNLKGKKQASFNVSGSQTVNTSLPSGMYFAKIHGVSAQHVRFIVK